MDASGKQYAYRSFFMLMKLKELKSKLDAFSGMEEADVVFGAESLEGLYVVEGVSIGSYAEETPEGCTTKMVLLWNGKMK